MSSASHSAAAAYDRHVGRYAAELADGFVAFVGVPAGGRTLDVGSGPGALAARLAAAVGAERVAAVDPSADYVAACRARIPGADVRQAAAEDLPFADGSFDVVMAQLVVQALRDPQQAARELVRVARPGATVATCVWDFREGMPLLQAFWAAAHAVDPAGAHRAGNDFESPWCTREGLEELWSWAGLEDVETTSLRASARYEDTADAWWSFAAGAGITGAYCASLPEDVREALAGEFRRRLDPPREPFELTARAWAVRGRIPPVGADASARGG